MKIKLQDIHVDWEWNCRGGLIGPLDVVDLVRSIRENGLLQPLVVINAPDWKDCGGRPYLLIIGHRRYRAMSLLEMAEADANVITITSEVEALALNVIENIARQQLSIRQEVDVVKRFVKLGYTRGKIAERLKVSTGWVQMRTYLGCLPTYVTAEVEAGMVKMTSVNRLYSIYYSVLNRSDEVEAEDELLKAVKKLKDAKILGHKRDPLTGIEERMQAGRMRNKKEIFSVQELIMNNVGPCLATRALAWAAGCVPLTDFKEALQDECELQGRIYSDALREE